VLREAAPTVLVVLVGCAGTTANEGPPSYPPAIEAGTGWSCRADASTGIEPCFRTMVACLESRRPDDPRVERIGVCEKYPLAYCTTWKMTLGGKEYQGYHCTPTLEVCGRFKAQSLEGKASVRDVSRCDPYR
jgi:hypothetical protein